MAEATIDVSVVGAVPRSAVRARARISLPLTIGVSVADLVKHETVATVMFTVLVMFKPVVKASHQPVNKIVRLPSVTDPSTFTVIDCCGTGRLDKSTLYVRGGRS